MWQREFHKWVSGHREDVFGSGVFGARRMYTYIWQRIYRRLRKESLPSSVARLGGSSSLAPFSRARARTPRKPGNEERRRFVFAACARRRAVESWDVKISSR